MTLQDLLKSFILDNLQQQPCFVGFSGGIDSTALLLLLHDCGVNATAVHFQHGIRGDDAEDDAQWCRRFCQERSIPFKLLRLNVPEARKPRESLEDAARRLRLEAWMSLAPNAAVFLAHHADDVLEDLFLRLARGSNATGLTGLRQRRVIGNVLFLRPLLAVKKAQLQQFLQQQNVNDWRLDATNLENDYRRNAVRNKLLPLWNDIFGTDAGIAQSLHALHQDALCLEELASQALKPTMSLADWKNIPPALLPRVFRLWRQTQDGSDTPPTKPFLQELSRKLQTPNLASARIQLDAQTQVLLNNSGLKLLQQSLTTDFDYAWSWQTSPTIHIPEANITLTASLMANCYDSGCNDGVPNLGGCDVATDTPATRFTSASSERFDLAQIPAILHVRSWKQGDKLIPFGKHSPKKVQDLLTDAHIPRELKHTIPIVTANDTIIWIPNVKRAEYARVTRSQHTVTLTIG